MLMVGTLQCRGSNLHSVDLYNDFISSQRRVLDANSFVLKGHFMREAGVTAGPGEYDRFATSLANRYSAQLDNIDFCETVDEFVRAAARASPEELMRLADTVAEAPETGRCDRSSDRFADAGHQPRGHTPPPPPRIPIVEPAEPVAVAAAPEAPVAAPAEGKKGVIGKAVAAAAPEAGPPPAAAPAQQVREQALHSAIVALQSAITALQATSAPAPAPAASDASVVRIEESPAIPPPPTEK